MALARWLALPACAPWAMDECPTCATAKSAIVRRIASGTGTIFDPAWRSPEPPMDAPRIAPCSGSIVVVTWDMDAHEEYGRVLCTLARLDGSMEYRVRFVDALLWVRGERVRSPWPARTP